MSSMAVIVIGLFSMIDKIFKSNYTVNRAKQVRVPIHPCIKNSNVDAFSGKPLFLLGGCRTNGWCRYIKGCFLT